MSIPPTGLISEIDFLNPACFTPGGTAVTDLSGSGNNWTFTDNTYSFNSFNGTITFPAGNLPLTCPKFYFGNTPFTVSYWFYFEYSDPISHSFRLGDYYVSTNFVTCMAQIGGHMSFYFGSNVYLGPQYCETPDGVLLDRQYNNICITFDGTTAKTYVNNVNYNSIAATINQTGTEPAIFNDYIGGSYRLKGLGLAYFYDVALNSTQVGQIYDDGYLRLGGINAPDVSIDFQNPACFTNGGTAITDLSGNGKNFTLTSTSYTFDNTNGSITMPNGVLANSTPSNFLYGKSPLSMLCWLNLGTGSYQTNICRIGGDACGSRLMPYFTATNDYFIMDGACTAGAWPLTIAPGWHLVALTRPGNCTTGDIKLYIDGVLLSQSGSYQPYIPNDMNNAVFGALNDSYVGIGKPLNIATFDIYTTEISGPDILDKYNNEVSRFITTTPIVEYDFQNGSYSGTGSTITDLQGGDTNLTVGNGHWVSGVPNYFDLQGDTNLFNNSPGIGFSSTTFTVNCWYNPLYTNPGTFASVWSLGIDGNPTSPILSTNVDGTLNIQWSFGYGLVGTTVTNDWHLISFVSNGSTTTLYVDGISIGSNASSSGTVASPYTIRLGSSSNSSNNPWQYSYGKIGYWSYFDVDLDATQVLDLYNATSEPYLNPLPPVTGLSNGRRFGQGFPQ